MRGLFIKDLMLLKMQSRYFISLVAVSVIMAVMGMEQGFIIGYLCVVIPMFSLSTVSYDEFDNGYAFLFTLPITKKGYVLEKYCFGGFLGVVAVLLLSLISVCMGLYRNDLSLLDTFTGVGAGFVAVLILLSFMMPLQLKFGSEKGRIVRILIAGGIYVLFFGISELFPAFDDDLGRLFVGIGKMSTPVFVAGSLLILLALLAASFGLSVKIMNKRSF